MANKSEVVQQRSNPQPCGFFNDPSRECICTPPIVQQYVAKISERTVEVLVQRLLRGFDLPPEIALTEPPAEVRLRIAKPAMNCLVGYFRFLVTESRLTDTRTNQIHGPRPMIHVPLKHLGNSRHTGGTQGHAKWFNC